MTDNDSTTSPQSADVPETMELWEHFFATPRALDGMQVLKPFNKSGFRGTAIAPMYVVRRLTERFGPCGKGWGVEYTTETINVDDNHVMAVAHVTLWYVLYGQECSINQIGQTWLKYQASRIIYDEDAFKKAVTDGLTKAASWLGLGADVHSGVWDGDKWTTPQEPSGSPYSDDSERPATPPRPAPKNASTGTALPPTPPGFPDLKDAPNDHVRCSRIITWLENTTSMDELRAAAPTIHHMADVMMTIGQPKLAEMLRRAGKAAVARIQETT